MANHNLPFSEEYRDKLLDMDFIYFLDDHLRPKDTAQTTDEKAQISKSFKTTTAEIEKRYAKDKKQCRLWLEGLVRLQWGGGMLPAHFRLDGSTRRFNYFDPTNTGEEQAYFQYWQKLERRRRFRRITWDRITKIGAVLAIILTIIKLVNTFWPQAK